jgi:CubicO group peptidase (beta-lactamase class C family)
MEYGEEMSPNTINYFPPPESKGGWRYLKEPDEIREVAGMDVARLDAIYHEQERRYGEHSWSIAIIRHGWLVREFHTFNVLAGTRFDIWSGTKSFSGTAWGLLFNDSLQGRIPQAISLDTPAYPFIPEGYPLSDKRKESITFRQLLSMTSGIRGEDSDCEGMATSTWVGPFEFALGKAPNRFGKWADQLTGKPGTCFEYSDPAICHLALAFTTITGREMDDYLHERIFRPIGIENLSWDVQGGGGFLGPHTNAHTGVHISARELARFCYLMLKRGSWEGQQLVPEWWLDLATCTSQEFRPSYGYTWWVNTRDARWPGMPTDMFALSGYRYNKGYVIPSLDLVITRVGSGPANDPDPKVVTWNEQDFVRGIVEACIK